MFIYKITNTKNGKIYIGQSIRPIEQRFRRHINDATNNILDTHFARAIRKYGPENFVIELLDSAKTQSELNEKEQFYIIKYDSVNNGYNETDAIYKCGGNTYLSKSESEMNVIKEKIRISKIGAKNPNSRAVKAKNVDTNEEFFFDTVEECKRFFGEKHHRFITTRVKKETYSLYKGVWNIAYKEDEYFKYATRTVVRKKQID